MNRTLFTVSRRQMLAGMAGVAATTALAGCDTSSVNVSQLASDTGSFFNSFKDMSESDEETFGAKLYPALIDTSGGAYPNRAVQREVQRFAEPLFATSAHPAFRYEITVIDDDTPNAWALPGGKIAVNKGALRYVANADELAAVLSHEMGHVEGRHAINELKTKRMTSSFTDIFKHQGESYVAEKGVPTALTTPFLDAIQGPLLQLVTTGYSRDHELEADANIMTVYKATGYHPKRASGFFHTLLEIIPPNSTGTTSLFNSYPGTQERVTKIETAAAALPDPSSDPASRGWNGIKETFPTRVYFKRTTAAG